MVKIILAIAIISCASAMGYLKSQNYTLRVKLLNENIDMLKLLETEMKYRRDPLPEILKRLAFSKENTANKFVKRVCELLDLESMYLELNQSWIQGCEEIFADTGLTREDINILSDLGLTLGRTGLEGQSSMFEMTYIKLSENLKIAEREATTKGKMYRTLGISGGIIIAVVLI